MHASVSNGTQCQPSLSSNSYESISKGISYHVSIAFNSHLVSRQPSTSPIIHPSDAPATHAPTTAAPTTHPSETPTTTHAPTQSPVTRSPTRTGQTYPPTTQKQDTKAPSTQEMLTIAPTQSNCMRQPHDTLQVTDLLGSQEEEETADSD
eukprot:415327_1